MEVSPSLLRRTGGALLDAAAQVRSALSGDRTGPAGSAWASDAELRVQSDAWDSYLAGLAARLDAAGDRLTCAADGYADADAEAARRLGRRLC
jgi:uncharacterized protein YukE